MVTQGTGHSTTSQPKWNRFGKFQEKESGKSTALHMNHAANTNLTATGCQHSPYDAR
jgi:hypothetical protein